MSDTQAPWYADVVMPALLGAARRGYGRAMRTALEAAGFNDIPPRGMALLGGIARNGPAGPDVAGQLGVRGERAARMITVLTERGYIEAGPDAGQYTLTEKGRAAAEVGGRAVDGFEEQARKRVGADRLAEARAVLGEIAELGNDMFE